MFKTKEFPWMVCRLEENATLTDARRTVIKNFFYWGLNCPTMMTFFLISKECLVKGMREGNVYKGNV